MKISIRDLMWLAVFAAVLAACWVEHKLERDDREREAKQLYLEAEKISRDALKTIDESFLNSSAPAASSPNSQAGPDNDP